MLSSDSEDKSIWPKPLNSSVKRQKKKSNSDKKSDKLKRIKEAPEIYNADKDNTSLNNDPRVRKVLFMV